MDRWTWRINCHATHHSTLQADDVVAEGAQALSEEHILFQAVAASTANNHFALKRCQIEPWRPPEHDIERLIGNGMRVRQNELMQCTERRFERTIIANTPQPSTLIKLRAHLKPSITLGVSYRRSGSCLYATTGLAVTNVWLPGMACRRRLRLASGFARAVRSPRPGSKLVLVETALSSPDIVSGGSLEGRGQRWIVVSLAACVWVSEGGPL